MKDYTKKQLEEGRPNISSPKGIAFCLERLYADTEHKVLSEIVKGLTFEELIGTLLVAKDEIKMFTCEVLE